MKLLLLAGLCSAASAGSLTDKQQRLVDVWTQRSVNLMGPSEKSVDNVMGLFATGVNEPHTYHVPTMAGAAGSSDMTEFYKNDFILSDPAVHLETISLTVGDNQLATEMVMSFKHTDRMPWLAPSVEPTGKAVKIPMVAVVKFQEEDSGTPKIVHEHLYWDQASVLSQLGVLKSHKYDITGAEQAAKLSDQSATAFNPLEARHVAEKLASTERPKQRVKVDYKVSNNNNNNGDDKTDGATKSKKTTTTRNKPTKPKKNDKPKTNKRAKGNPEKRGKTRKGGVGKKGKSNANRRKKREL